MLLRLLIAGLLSLGLISTAYADFEFTDLACETTATTGTGTVNLAGAVANYLGFLAAGIDTGDTVPYLIVSGDGKRETGIGTVTDGTPDTMSRTADWSSDGSGAELTLSGTSTVCIGPIASIWSNADKGDVTTSNGFATWTIDGDSVALTTDTTGNYAAGDGEAGAALTGDSATSFFSTGTLGAAQLPAATESDQGAAELATTTEADTGTDTTRAVTAAGVLTAVVGKQTIWVPASALKNNVTSPASCGDTFDSGSNDLTITVCAFDAGATEERADFQIAMPKNWNESTVTAVPMSTCTGGCTSTQTIQYEVSCVAVSHDDTLNAAMGTPQTSSVTVTAAPEDDLLTGAETSAITCAGTPAESDYVAFRVSRDTSVDNATGDSLLLGLKVHYTTNNENDD